ncbi:beta-N-acetylhexosaminidase [Actinokineospora sp. NBRC 105648]|uniref:beta-N-acetylhexosaminidase n=1 Tax=Actinokineospora sp. NBRC 105648 TaxID=3032206 RepID=UPI0024A06384|nr:beta-N-acetylhexosaminidase [Actinokineospora sp. NBRC 105648]GLZ40697.1 beta-N-acetylhexosaminidase [Actinokineospora sp. NBRC 105648]
MVGVAVLLTIPAAAVPAVSSVVMSPGVESLVPKPVAADTGRGRFVLDEDAHVVARGAAREVGEYLAGALRPATGYRLPVSTREARRGDIVLEVGAGKGPAGHTAEGYRLVTDRWVARVSADTPAGLFLGVQTLRQLLPAWVDSPSRVDGPWSAQAATVTDYPRFAYRGVMLDVARSFLTVDEVKRYIDSAVRYKVNTLHLHLTDDQAWRIAVNPPPVNPAGLDYGALTRVGGTGGSDTLGNGTPLGTGPARRGFYTQRDYTAIVAHARARFVTVVPEVDGPGHTNAALASVPQLNPNGQTKPMNNTADVGYSTLDANAAVTYEFLTTVLSQLAALTPGPYLHIGGDEALVTGHDNYLTYLTRTLPIVAKLGKLPMGWNEYAAVDLPPGAVVHYWRGALEPVLRQVARGAKVVMSPAGTSYLDQKYEPSTPIGLSWACRNTCDYDRYYDWEPVRDGLAESDVLGVAGPLWSETVRSLDQAEWLSYPRLISLAEIGWTPKAARDLTGFTGRLATQGSRLTIAGVNFRPSPAVPWTTDITARSQHSRTIEGEIGRFTAPTTATPTAVVDFGDGNTTTATVTPARPAGPLAAPGVWRVTIDKHRYPRHGTYQGTLTVTTPAGEAKAHFTVRTGH